MLLVSVLSGMALCFDAAAAPYPRRGAKRSARQVEQKVTVDYPTIEKIVAQPGYYDALEERLVADDPTLTLNDYVVLYYGMAFCRRGYALGTVSYNIYKFRCDDKLREAYELGEEYLRKVPASVILLADHCSTVGQLKRPQQEIDKYRRRFESMMAAIAASGDGRTPDTAFKVLDSTSESCVWSYLLAVDFSDTKTDWDRKIIRYKVTPNEKYPYKDLYIDFNSPDRDDYVGPDAGDDGSLHDCDSCLCEDCVQAKCRALKPGKRKRTCNCQYK